MKYNTDDFSFVHKRCKHNRHDTTLKEFLQKKIHSIEGSGSKIKIDYITMSYDTFLNILFFVPSAMDFFADEEKIEVSLWAIPINFSDLVEDYTLVICYKNSNISLDISEYCSFGATAAG